MGPIKVIAWLFAWSLFQTGTGTIEVHCTGMEKPTRGMLMIYLYKDAVSWTNPQEYYRIYKYNLSAIPLSDFRLENLPFDTYAIRVHIDLNDNGEVDYNLLGQALEQTGYSNNPVKIFSKPTFRDARFALTKSTLQLDIELK